MRVTLVSSIHEHRDTPGAIAFHNEPPLDIFFVCPCGCRKIGSVNLRAGGWTWNGSREAPVLSPSVFFEQGRLGQWHGFLGGADGSRPGEWVSC